MNRDVKTDRTPEAVRERISMFCSWFDVEPVHVRTRLGKVQFSNEIGAWAHRNGASLDWILLGHVRGLATAFRDEHGTSPDGGVDTDNAA